jgi:hypothetical protein
MVKGGERRLFLHIPTLSQDCERLRKNKAELRKLPFSNIQISYQIFRCDTRQDIPIPCEQGEYGSGINTCDLCSPGKYCPRKALSTEYDCDAGYDCQSGCSTHNPVDAGLCDLCPVGSSCAQGVVAAVCPTDLYQPNIGQKTCLDCPERYECTTGTRSLCPAGQFCPGAAPAADCSNNFFNDQEGLASAGECFPCPPGVECDNSNKYQTPTLLCTQARLSEISKLVKKIVYLDPNEFEFLIYFQMCLQMAII